MTNHGRVNLRRAVVMLLCLAGCGPTIPAEYTVSGKSLEFWLDALSDNQPKVRIRAIRALGNLGPVAPEVVPAITAALHDSDPTVRGQAALALLKFGPEAKSAIPALTDAQNDADETVRNFAAKALENIEGG